MAVLQAEVNNSTEPRPTSDCDSTSEAAPVVVPPWYRQLWTIRLTLIFILTPILFVPIPIVFPSDAGKCAYAIMIMGIYWMTEVIPMAVTALLPVVIFPWLGIMETRAVCSNYLKDANMLFIGGLIVAVAVEKWNLHKRIAMKVLTLVGSKPPWLMFGFMTTTAFLSMWISNTATTAMMIPIAHAVLIELNNHRIKVRKQRAIQVTEPNNSLAEQNDKYEAINMEPLGDDKHMYENSAMTADDDVIDDDVTKGANGDPHACGGTGNSATVHPLPAATPVSPEQSKKATDDDAADDAWFETVGKGMRLSIAYAANIGGTATLTGTGPNLVLKGQLDTMYGSETGINFSSWFVFAFPNMLISLTLAWLWLMLLFIGPREIAKAFRRNDPDSKNDTAMDVIRAEMQKLGKMSFAEAMVLVHFIVMAVMWLTRDPEVVPGWGTFVPKRYVSDSCVAITISVLLFIVPSKFPNYLFFRRKTETELPQTAPPLLDWPTIHKQMPWNVMLLLGGGFALADGCKASGLSQVIGDFFVSFRHFPNWVLVLVLSTMTAAFTEVTSNVATATIFLPILAELARSIHLNPLYLMLPVTISASFAFMLPVATPPNAIVFAYGNMKIFDMMKAGLMMNIVCLLVLQLAINTWARAYFSLDSFPRWAGGLHPNFLDNSTASFLLNNTAVEQ